MSRLERTHEGNTFLILTDTRGDGLKTLLLCVFSRIFGLGIKKIIKIRCT